MGGEIQVTAQAYFFDLGLLHKVRVCGVTSLGPRPGLGSPS